MSIDSKSLVTAWLRTVELVKLKITNISFYEALEHSIPLAVDGETLVIGMQSQYGSEAGHFARVEYKAAVENAFEEVTGLTCKLRVVEGETVQDWEIIKQRDAKVAVARETTYVKRDIEAADSQNWDSLYEYAAKAFSATHSRQLPQNKSRYLTDMLYVLSDAMIQLNPDPEDDHTQRMIAKVIDRVAHNADVSGTIVALELERLLAWQRQQSAG